MNKRTRNISEEEIDNLAIAHADDDSAWEKPVRVRKSKSPAVSLPTKPTVEDSQEILPAALKVD